MSKDPQRIWKEYYQRIKRRRTSEARLLWNEMVDGGVTENTVLAIDFRHFSREKENAENLATQLREHYTVEVAQDESKKYWFVAGTTRPEGVTLNAEEHTGWVEFMADVAQSYACVFSYWSLTSPKLGKTFANESVEAEPEI